MKSERQGKTNGGGMSLSDTGHNPQKWFAEDIGIYSTIPVAPLLTSLESEFFYRLSSHTDLQAFHCWILSQRPQMIIVQAKLLSKASHEELQSLRNTLNTWGILTLLLAETVEEIRNWRASLWPRAHFYLGDLSEQTLKKKTLYLMNERMLLEEPSVLMLSRRPYLLSHFEGALRCYGIRLHVYPNAEEEFFSMLALDHPEALLCDVELEDSQQLISMVTENYISSSPFPIFMLSEEEQPKKNGETIFSPQESEKLLKLLIDAIYEKRQKRLTFCRDQKTGLYLKEAFFDVTEREMAISQRRSEEFSIVKLKLFSMAGLEKKYGPIFVSFLQTHLNTFIRNHVRATDFVAQGDGGEVLVLFTRVGKPVATLIGERLCHQFSKEATFRENAESVFQPSLGYEVVTYPHDFHKIDELREALVRNKVDEMGWASIIG